MRHVRMLCFALLLPLSCIELPGCQDATQNQNVLTFLEKGGARGHLTVTSDAGLSGGMTTEFFGGARGTRVAFDGDIDYGAVSATDIFDKGDGEG